MDAHFLSRFTPSLMAPETLEAIFVQREELLQSILESIGISALTRDKKHTLLVGPRGIGKTHLISMIYYRLQAVDELKDRILVAWLREEEWGVSCFRDFLLRILRSLTVAGDQAKELEQRLKSIYALETGGAEAAAYALIKELAHDRTLVILAENFDELIRKFAGSEEAKLYRFLQEGGLCCVVATSPAPVSRVFPPGSPFTHGFFTVHQLTELTFEDSINLIGRIARYLGDQELGSLILTPRGRARVRALRYLAGGNHRACVIFAPLLAVDAPDQLVRKLAETIDDLTPYYTARIAALPLEQRKIIEYVSEYRHPVRLEEIARSCFLAPAVASTHTDILCKLGYLQSFKLETGRYYELREPLMRLSFEVKKQRGKPMGLILDFLRLWYSASELGQRLASLSFRSDPEQIGIPSIQVLRQDWHDPRIAECCREYNAAIGTGDYEKALQAAEELVAVRGSRQDLMAQAFCLCRLACFAQAVSVYDRVIELGQDDAEIWRLRAWALYKAGRVEEALSSCSKSLQLFPDSIEAWRFQAQIFLETARPREALDSCEAAIRLNDADAESWSIKGRALADLGLFEKAAAAFSQAVQLKPSDGRARVHWCAALVELNRCDQALEQANAAIEIDPQDCGAWVLKGVALSKSKRFHDALMCLQKAVILGDDSSFVHFKIAELLLALDRWREGIAHLDRALERFAHSANPEVGDSRALIRNLFPNLGVPEILRLSIKILLLIYRKHRLLAALAQGLIECIPEVVSSTEWTDADAWQWLTSWKAISENYPEFRLPLRLLECAVSYRKNRDLTILMDLAQEERKLLEPLLGVQVEALA